MTALLMLRDRLKRIYADYDLYIRPILKFCTACFCLLVLNLYIGTLSAGSALPLLLLGSLICAAFPWGMIPVVCAASLIAGMYETSLVMATVTFAVMLVIGILYFGFRPGNAIVLALIPLTFVLRIPFVMPMILGLSLGASAALPAVFGVLIWFLMRYFHDNFAVMSGTETSELLSEFVRISRGVFQNKYMIVVMLAFVLCILAVGFIHTLSIDHAWTVAIAAGAAVLLIVMVLLGAFIENSSLLWDILGMLISIALAILYEHVFFSVDYRGVERVQFEDDDYYYYVKAVPKIRYAEDDERRE